MGTIIYSKVVFQIKTFIRLASLLATHTLCNYKSIIFLCLSFLCYKKTQLFYRKVGFFYKIQILH